MSEPGPEMVQTSLWNSRSPYIWTCLQVCATWYSLHTRSTFVNRFAAIKVIKELTVQRARSELFTMAMEVELRNHRHIQKLLTAVLLLLQKISTCLQDRMVS